MPDFTWMSEEELLSPAALTVRAQAVSPNDNGQLLWDSIMPRVNVDQTKLSSLSNQDVRITSDRREWNQRGRYINLVTPPKREMEWIPIEGYFKLEESEINTLMNEVRGNQALFRSIIGARVPERTNTLADANYRRLELDVMSSWANGNITMMDPQLGITVTVSYGFSSSRYLTAGTAWSDAGTNAFNELTSFLANAADAMGVAPIGVMLRTATFNAIMADAPNPIPGIGAGIRPTRAQVEQLIQDMTGAPFRFFINERTVQTFTDGGITRQVTKVWPAMKVAAVPPNFRVGSTAFAPVVRAYDLTSQVPDAGIDLRGQTVYHDVNNGGRELVIEAQFNPMPDPDENMLYVINAGV